MRWVQPARLGRWLLLSLLLRPSASFSSPLRLARINRLNARARRNFESPTDSGRTTPETDPEYVAIGSRKQTYYELLGCAPDATRDEIKANYIALARKIHPDSRINREYCTETIPEFTDVATAWKVLRDPQLRLRYDRTLQSEKFVDSFEEKAESVLRDAFGKLELVADSVGSTLGNAAVAAERVGSAFGKMNSAFSKAGKKAKEKTSALKNGTRIVTHDEESGIGNKASLGKVEEAMNGLSVAANDVFNRNGEAEALNSKEVVGASLESNKKLGINNTDFATELGPLYKKVVQGQVKRENGSVVEQMMTDNVKEAISESSVEATDLVNGKVEVGGSLESGPGARMTTNFWPLGKKAKRGNVKREDRFNTGNYVTTGITNEAVNGSPKAEGDLFNSREAKRAIQESEALGINITDAPSELGPLYQKAGQVKHEGQSVVGKKGKVGKGIKAVNRLSVAANDVVSSKEDASSILESGKAPDVDIAGVATKFQPLDKRAERGKGSAMAEAASKVNPKLSKSQNAYFPAEGAPMARAPAKAGERSNRVGSLERNLSARPLLSKVVPVDYKRASSSSATFNSTVPHRIDVSWHSKPELFVSSAAPSSHFGGSAYSNVDVTAKRPMAPSGRPVTDAATGAFENERSSSPVSKVAPGEARSAPFVASSDSMPSGLNSLPSTSESRSDESVISPPTPIADASRERSNKSPAQWSAFGVPHPGERWSAFGVPPPHEH